ncbi:hypothetical protein C8J57DRAFT_1481399 [Mycena rebaudengoi]|nr:hypothetical protein C8J57DRAFT_1481399 [Mycena rebaudengoi]
MTLDPADSVRTSAEEFSRDDGMKFVPSYLQSQKRRFLVTNSGTRGPRWLFQRLISIQPPRPTLDIGPTAMRKSMETRHPSKFVSPKERKTFSVPGKSLGPLSDAIHTAATTSISFQTTPSGSECKRVMDRNIWVAGTESSIIFAPSIGDAQVSAALRRRFFRSFKAPRTTPLDA